METYRHLSQTERASISALKVAGVSCADIAKQLGRSRSTISREIRRNSCNDGRYRVEKADKKARSRSRISRRNLSVTEDEWNRITTRLRDHWSPEQIVGSLKKLGLPTMSHEMIYRRIVANRVAGGDLWTFLRCSRKKKRKRYGAYDSRGRLSGKRMIDERPTEILSRNEIGHWEGDTVMGKGSVCLLTLVERKSGFTLIMRLEQRTKDETNRAIIQALMPYQAFCKSITFDNGTEFHGYKEVEEKIKTTVYFAHPHSPHERGTNENTNGLVRQFAPKRTTMFQLTQNKCHVLANKLNLRPRKRHSYQTPSDIFLQHLPVALQS
jgi:IS30 family transposase